MNPIIGFLFLAFGVVELAACTIGNGRICGPQTPISDCDKEAYEKLVHPKTYGEYWIKPEMTRGSWRLDWISCGGRPNGDYSSQASEGATTEMIRADSKQISQKLGACMQSKGYEYQSNVAQPKVNEN